MAYVYLNDLYDAIVNSTAVNKSDIEDLIDHIAETSDQSILKRYVTDEMLMEYLENYPGDLLPFINDDVVEKYIEEQGSLCLDKFVDDDFVVDYCDNHGYQCLMGDEDDEYAVMEWCKNNNYVCFKKKE